MNKRFLKYFGGAALCLSAWLFYNSYSDQPNHSNVPPNALAVPFEQPLIIDPEKEQQFDFYFDKKQEINVPYEIRVLMYLPDEKDKKDGKDSERYQRYIEHLIYKEGWFFDISLDHYHPLAGYPMRMILEGAVEVPGPTPSVIEKAPFKWYVSSNIQPMRFTLTNIGHHNAERNGKVYLRKPATIAEFRLINRDGFYRLKIRPTRKLENYPKIEFTIDVGKTYLGK